MNYYMYSNYIQRHKLKEGVTILISYVEYMGQEGGR